VMGSASKVLIDQKGGNSLLYLPLDKLMEKSRIGNSTSALTSSTSSESSDNNAAQRARDSLLSRERGAR